MKKSLILLCIFFIYFTSFSQRINLSLNLDKGSNYKLSSTINSTINQEVNGQIMKIEMKTEGLINFHVDSILENQYCMSVQYDMLAMETTVRGQTMRYSSENENVTDMMSKLLSSLTKETFNCQINKNGSISQITGLEEMWGNIIDSLPGISGMDKEKLGQQLNKTYGKEAFKSSIGQSTYIFPDYSINIGERWWIESQIGAGIIPAKMECDYVLAENAEEYYKIFGSAYIQTDKEQSSPMNGMETQYDLRGEYNSEIIVNKESGWIIASQNEFFLQGEIFILPNNQLPNGMKVPFRMNSVSNITSK